MCRQHQRLRIEDLWMMQATHLCSGLDPGSEDLGRMFLLVLCYMSLSGLSAGTPYHWRIRLHYDPATTPFMPASRWLTMPWNGWNETDLRTATGIHLVLPLVLRNH